MKSDRDDYLVAARDHTGNLDSSQGVWEGFDCTLPSESDRREQQPVRLHSIHHQRRADVCGPGWQLRYSSTNQNAICTTRSQCPGESLQFPTLVQLLHTVQNSHAKFHPKGHRMVGRVKREKLVMSVWCFPGALELHLHQQHQVQLWDRSTESKRPSQPAAHLQ